MSVFRGGICSAVSGRGCTSAKHLLGLPRRSFPRWERDCSERFHWIRRTRIFFDPLCFCSSVLLLFLARSPRYHEETRSHIQPIAFVLPVHVYSRIRGWSRGCLWCWSKVVYASRRVCIGGGHGVGMGWIMVVEGIAMLGMFNTGATTRHEEMVDFSHGINLVESYLPDAISCLPANAHLKIFQAAARAKTLIAPRCNHLPSFCSSPDRLFFPRFPKISSKDSSTVSL